MTLKLEQILESKRAMRQKLRSMPIEEKLRMLDDLRERTRELRRAGKTASNDPPAPGPVES